MIKLKRHLTPIKLSPKFVQDSTDEFKLNGTNVWNIQWLKSALLSLSNEKCSYCECSLSEESKYMEVEHFEDKNQNPDKVLEWDNLLPSCKRCNGAKSTHDVVSDPIVNPFIDEPKDEFYFRLYKIKGKTQLGKIKEGVINLNDTERAVRKRFEVGEALENQIENCSERLERYKENNTVIRRNKLVVLIREILNECNPQAIYSATCSTILISNEKYLQIKKYMQENELWDNELEELNNEANSIKINIR